MFDQDYRVSFPERRVYVSRNHQWAFAAWAMARKWEWTSAPTTLLHVDAHLDDTWDGVTVPGLKEMKEIDDFMSVAAGLEIDNFIWAGFAARTIDRIVYVCPKDIDASDPFDLSDWDLNGEQLNPIKQLLEERDYTGLRFESITALRQSIQADVNASEEMFPLPGSVILDLDLDVFKANVIDPLDLSLKPDWKIKEELSFLRDLYPYDLISVALSPSFCGGEDNCAKLYGLFLECFGLDPSMAEAW